jgi:hypothetical protein
MFHHIRDKESPQFQITKFESEHVVSINIYRSAQGSVQDILECLLEMVVEDKTNIISGDINICLMAKPQNKLTTTLVKEGFIQMVKTPTHIQGGHLDHLYIRDTKLQHTAVLHQYSPYHSDHDGICLTLTKVYSRIE